MNIADVVERLPGEAFTLAGRLINEIDRFRQACLKAEINLERTVDELLADTSFWRYQRHRVIKRFKPNIDAISIQLETLLDDVIAVAHCREADDLIASSYAQAKERKDGLQSRLAPGLPVGESLDNLKDYATDLRAQLGDLLH